MASFKTYYRLSKPGIIYGNALPLVAGYMLAFQQFSFVRLVAALVGQSLVIAGACVFNNVLDRNIDKRMERTKRRATVTGEIPVMTALIFAACLSIIGLVTLLLGTNVLTTLIGLAGLLLYVLAYGWGKRHTTLGTAIGAIPGALPPVAGYTAATGSLDATAGWLFLVLAFWQMPHFYAIGMFRSKEYAAAGVKILPLVRSSLVMRRRITLYMLLFMAASVALGYTAHLGVLYYLVAAGIGLYWIYWGVAHRQAEITKWARKMFGLSLIALLGICTAIAAGRFLP